MSCSTEFDSFNSYFMMMRSDLEEISPKMSSFEASIATSTLQSFKIIYEQFAKLKDLESDRARNNLINQAVSLSGIGAGAEEGFSSSSQALKERIVFLVDTYLKSKEKHKLKDFYCCFSKGDRCLSGKTESLYLFRAGLEGLDINSMEDPSKHYDVLGFIFSNFLTFNDETITSEYVKTSLNHPLIRVVLKENLDSLSADLASLKSNPLYRSFDAFLKEYLQWPEEKMFDFKSILETLLDSKYFNSIMLKTAEYIV
jgi:hypothetical protein